MRQNVFLGRVCVDFRRRRDDIVSLINCGNYFTQRKNNGSQRSTHATRRTADIESATTTRAKTCPAAVCFFCAPRNIGRTNKHITELILTYPTLDISVPMETFSSRVNAKMLSTFFLLLHGRRKRYQETLFALHFVSFVVQRFGRSLSLTSSFRPLRACSRSRDFVVLGRDMHAFTPLIGGSSHFQHRLWEYRSLSFKRLHYR